MLTAGRRANIGASTIGDPRYRSVMICPHCHCALFLPPIRSRRSPSSSRSPFRASRPTLSEPTERLAAFYTTTVALTSVHKRRRRSTVPNITFKMAEVAEPRQMYAKSSRSPGRRYRLRLRSNFVVMVPSGGQKIAWRDGVAEPLREPKSLVQGGSAGGLRSGRSTFATSKGPPLTSFVATNSYSARGVLILGLATFAGCLGLGLLLLRLLRMSFPAPFGQIVAVLLGIQVSSLAVQIAAMAQAATPAVLIAIWCASLVCGAAGWIFRGPRSQSGNSPSVPWSAIVIAGSAAGLDLMAAVVPSSKIDELYYHMLMPARIVADHGLKIYRAPIESALLPQMNYQIFAAPLHALGFPDAPNIVSWMLSLMLVWLGWTLLRQRGVSNPIAYSLVASLLVGVYPIVFLVTGGGHAFGDLSLATAVLALALADELMVACGPVRFAFMVSLLAWSAASSKVSLLPVAGMVTALGGLFAWRALGAAEGRARLLAALAAPWLVLGAPLIVWTYVRTGSPFGPLLAGYFGESVFPPEMFPAFADAARSEVRIGSVMVDNLASYSPLVWLGAIGALVSRTTPSPIRKWGSVLLLGQLLIIAWQGLYNPRYLGGIQYGLALSFALYLPPRFARPSAASTLVIVMSVAPWLSGQFIYGQQFARMAFGLEDRDTFYRRYVAFYDDFTKLDHILPPNAVLLAPDFRGPAVYAPRPMVFDPADVPRGGDVYLFSADVPEMSDYPASYVIGSEVYVNRNAKQKVFRRFWVAPETGVLHVVHVDRR
jgi:hypothetical protein